MFNLFKKKKTTKIMAMNDEFKSQLIGATIQYQKGELIGRLKKITDIRMDGPFEHFFFADGTKEMSIKFPDWFIPIDDEFSAPIPIVRDVIEDSNNIINEVLPEQQVLIPAIIEETTLIKSQETPKNIDSPILLLLNKQKREKRDLSFNLELEIPNPSSMKILRESFDDFDEVFLDWLKQDKNILNSILEAIKKTIIE